VRSARGRRARTALRCQQRAEQAGDVRQWQHNAVAYSRISHSAVRRIFSSRQQTMPQLQVIGKGLRHDETRACVCSAKAVYHSCRTRSIAHRHCWQRRAAARNAGPTSSLPGETLDRHNQAPIPPL
jgi:hypothetical protein